MIIMKQSHSLPPTMEMSHGQGKRVAALQGSSGPRGRSRESLEYALSPKVQDESSPPPLGSRREFEEQDLDRLRRAYSAACTTLTSPTTM